MMTTTNEVLSAVRTRLAARTGQALPATPIYAGVRIPDDELLVGEVIEMPYGGRSWETRSVAGIADAAMARGLEPPYTLAQLKDLFAGDAELATTLDSMEADASPALSAPEQDALQQTVADWTGTDEEIAQALNTPDAALPIPGVVTQRAKPLSMSSIMGKLAGASRAKVSNGPAMERIIDDVRRGDRTAVLNWAQLLLDRGDISAEEAAAIQDEVRALEDVPGVVAHFSRAQQALGRHITPAEVAQARPDSSTPTV